MRNISQVSRGFVPISSTLYRLSSIVRPMRSPTWLSRHFSVPQIRMSCIISASYSEWWAFLESILSTPFTYHPCTRPTIPLPGRLRSSPSNLSFVESPEWHMFEDHCKVRGGQDITSKVSSDRSYFLSTSHNRAQLYLPTSRVFCLRQPIPFHLTFTSSAFSLAAFFPLLPTANPYSPNRQYTKIELLRQCTVDVR